MKIYKFLLPLLVSLPILIRGQQLNLVHSDKASAKLYFVFNQPGYVAGDTAFFKTYLVGDGLKFTGKTIMGIAFYKGDDRVLFQRIVIKERETSGYLSIPAKIQPGVYSMLVELNGSIFESEFIISGDQKYTAKSNLNFKPSQFTLLTDFHDEIYQTGQKASVNIELSKFTLLNAKTISVSIIREDLFDQRNVKVCLPTQLNVETKKESFPVYFSGKVVDSEGRKLPDSLKLTFYLNKNDLVYPVYTDKNGEFRFPLFKNFESDEIFYAINYRGSKEYDLKIQLNDLARSSVGIHYDYKESSSEVYSDFNNRRKIIAESYHYFLNENVPNENADHGEDFLADHVIKLDRFEPFSSMSELIINIIPAVRYKKNSKRETVRVFLKENAQIAAGDPVYIIDGVMTDSTEAFLNISPAKIKEITILRSRETLRRFGDFGRNGIIIVKSKIAEGLTIPRPKRTLFITGINPIATFNNTVQEANRSNPDVRSCLYWNADLGLDDSGHGSLLFHTGAITGPVKLIIQAVLSDGSLYYHEDKGVIHFPTP